MYLYDLTRQPPWWDFLVGLAACATDAQGPFDLAILRGTRNDGLNIDRDARVGFVHTVMMPATRLYQVRELQLFPHAIPDGRMFGYQPRDMYQLNDDRTFKPIPSIKVPPWARKWAKEKYQGKGLVTISTREASHNPHRNSDMNVWQKVAHELYIKGYEVVFLRDTTATANIAWKSDWAASNSLLLRAAVYEQAVMNLGTVHGPTSLCALNAKANYLLFDKEPPVAGMTEQWMRHSGLDPDADREPWALPGQRVMWERATVNRVMDEFAVTTQEKNAEDAFTVCDRPNLMTTAITIGTEPGGHTEKLEGCVKRFFKHPHKFVVGDGDLFIPRDIIPVGNIRAQRGRITPDSKHVARYEDCKAGIPDWAKFIYFKDGIENADSDWVKELWGSSLSNADYVVTPNTREDETDRHVRINGKRGLPWFTAQDMHKGTAVLVGGAPSLKETLPHIRARKKRGQKIWALNGVHDYLIENGIIPDVMVMMDARQDNVKFVQKPHKDVHYLICSKCHPDVFDALEGHNVTLWHAYTNYQDTWLAREFPDHAEPYVMVGGGTTVGSRALYLVKQAGFYKIHLYGYDSSYRDDEDHAYKQPVDSADPKVECFVGDKKFVTRPWMIKQLHSLVDQMSILMNGRPPCQIQVHGDGLFPYYVSQTMEKAA